MNSNEDDLRCVKEARAAGLLDLSASGLRKMRIAGTGPKSFRVGKRQIRYRISDLREWLLARPAATSAGRGSVIAMTKGGSRGG